MEAPHVEGRPEQQDKGICLQRSFFFQPLADLLDPSCILVLLGFGGLGVGEVLLSWESLESSPGLNHGP